MSEITKEVLRYFRLHRPPTTAAPVVRSEIPITISLTTLPERLPFLYRTLSSLTDQTTAAHQIIIWIPKQLRRGQGEYRTPEWLSCFPGVSLRQVPEDLGPITKLVPALAEFWHTADMRIISLDDDVIYPRRLVECMARYTQEYPEAALGGIGYRIPKSYRDADRNRCKVYAARLLRPEPVEVLSGYGAYLVRPHFFSRQFLDTSQNPESAFYSDDIWISGSLATRSVARLVIPIAARFSALKTRTSQSPLSLCRTANRDGHHNEQMMTLFADHWQHYG